MSTIRQVAKLSGVSIGTVSKVLNGCDDRVDPESRERILASIRQLRYKPPPFERNQRPEIVKNLGMIVPDLFEHPLVRNSYLHLLLDGVLERAAFHQWSITIFVATMWDDVGNAVRRKYDGRCDGLIVVAPQPSHDIVPSLQRRGEPVVLIGTTAWLEHISSIDIDNFEAGRIVAQHFHSLGHRKLAYVAHNQDHVSSQERYAGFCSIAGGDTPRYFLDERLSMTAFVTELRDMGRNRPTGIMAWHDGMAIRLIKAFDSAGIHVPGDISVVGVDNLWDAADEGVQLTSIENPLHEIGLRAASMTIDRVLDPSMPSESVKLPPRLILKGTTARLLA
ncbi:MAG: LacI family DNA-binding transcriptional regulator [Fimbriimonas sp.]|nr:LacI family DNA-binding transcriptional regulator [Fimbriimonas sp.]